MDVIPIFRNTWLSKVKKHGENYTGDDIYFWKPLEEEPIITIVFLVCIGISLLVGLVGNVLVSTVYWITI